MEDPGRGFAKAQIRIVKTNEDIPCMFNPKELSLVKSNSWPETDVKQGNVSRSEFGGGKPTDMKMQLFFDTYETGKDVRDHTDKVWKLMEVVETGEGKIEPATCWFRWGTYVSFLAVVTSITQQFTLFLHDGTPVRSTLDVSFKEIIDKKKEGPREQGSATGKAGHRTRRVKQRETLDLIAFEEYGDPSKWRYLADANKLNDPMSLEAGAMLTIPPPPD